MKLKLSNISKSFNGLSVLENINTEFQSGKCYCLTGPSGTGKTTLLRIIMGLEKEYTGNISSSIPLEVSAVFQENRLCETFSPIENVKMVCKKGTTPALIHSELCRLLPEECLTRPVSTLSGGMKRRVAIARAVLAPSNVIIMDEPFTGLDDSTRQTVIHYIKEKTENKLLILSTHQEEDISLLDGIQIILSSKSI